MYSASAYSDKGLVSTMVPLDASLALVLNFTDTYILLMDWEEMLENAKCLRCQVPTKLLPKLAINSLEEDAWQTLKVLPKVKQYTLAQIVAQLEGLFRQNTSVTELQQRRKPSHTLQFLYKVCGSGWKRRFIQYVLTLVPQEYCGNSLLRGWLLDPYRNC